MKTGSRLNRRSFLTSASLGVVGSVVLAACAQAPAPTAAPAKPAEAAKPAAAQPTAAPAAQSAAAPKPTAAPAAAPAAKPAQGAAPATLVVWKFGGATRELEYIPKWNDEFTKETGIKLEYSNNDWAVKREKMLAAFQAKRISDILLPDGQSIPDLAQLGVIVALDDLDKSMIEKWKPTVIPEIWNTTVHRGKVYATAPYVDMGTFLVYNKNMFAEAGITKVPTNWIEVREAAKKLTKADRAGITISATTNTNDANTFEGIAYNNGGRWLDNDGKKVMIEDAGFVDALPLFVDLANDKSVPQGVTETAFGGSATLFFEGKAAMWASLSYVRAIQQGQGRPDDFPLGMTVFPRPEKPTGAAQPASTIMTPTTAFMVTTLSQQREAALKYIDFWMRADVQKGWDGSAIGGRVPALKANWETETFKKVYPDWYQLHKDGKMFDGALPMPAFPGLAEAERALSTAMQQAVLGKASAKDALATAAKRAQAVVNEFQF
jgi:multiple sugar transport system substrate-binding protein